MTLSKTLLPKTVLPKTVLTLCLGLLLAPAAMAQPAPPSVAPTTAPPTISPPAAAPAAIPAPVPAAIDAAPATSTPDVAPAADAAAVSAQDAATTTPAQSATAAPAPAAKTPPIPRYTYMTNESEYMVDLPEAPVATTVWGDQKEPIPFLEKPPRFGSVGEVATYRRINEITGEYIDVAITVLKADRDFLLTRTPENMQQMLESTTKNILLEDKKFKYTPGAGTVKRMLMTGFSIDKNNNALYNAIYYLTGNASIMVIRVQYNIENTDFNAQYQQMAASIKYVGK